MSKSISFLYQLARTANDIEKLASGDPKRIARRAKNKYIGRKLIRKAWKFPFWEKKDEKGIITTDQDEIGLYLASADVSASCAFKFDEWKNLFRE